MSKIRLGINGFGRIGRMVFRASLKRNDVQVVGINDLLDVEHLAYLLKYDSVHGTCNASIEVKDGNLVVDNNIIRISAERDPKQIAWDSINTDIVAECTGIFTSLEKAQLHIDKRDTIFRKHVEKRGYLFWCNRYGTRNGSFHFLR